MDGEQSSVEQGRTPMPPRASEHAETPATPEGDVSGGGVSPDEQPTTTMQPLAMPPAGDKTSSPAGQRVQTAAATPVRAVPVTSPSVGGAKPGPQETAPQPAIEEKSVPAGASATPDARGFGAPPPWYAQQPGATYTSAPSPRKPAHMPWQAAASWGTSTILLEATTAAGASYLFWWLSGLFVYFHERENRYVRFHAMQSIMVTAALTVFSVLAYVISSLLSELALATQQYVFQVLGVAIGWLALCVVIFVWLGAMIAAWSGNYLRLPIVGVYAERYAAPPTTPPESY